MCCWFSHSSFSGIERRSRLVDIVDIEGGDHLLAREDLLVTVRPAQTHQIIEERIRQDTPPPRYCSTLTAPWRLESLAPSGPRIIGTCAYTGGVAPERVQHVHLPRACC